MRSRLALLLVLTCAALLMPSISSARELPPGATPLPGGGYALELRADTPDWYTDALHDRVVAAGRHGRSVPLPEEADVDSALLFAGIRPGSWMLFPSWCTMNFVFGSGTDLYIGTAGHCASVGDAVTIVAAPGVLMNIGTTVTSVDNGVGDDFALIKINPEMVEHVNPSMAYWAGPTGSAVPAFGTPIAHVGHGLGVGTGGTPRVGVVTWTGGEASEATGYGWDGAATPGDSGSGVRAITGAAAGNLTHLVVGTDYLPAYIAGTDIDRILQIAGVPLATASVLPDPLP